MGNVPCSKNNHLEIGAIRETQTFQLVVSVASRSIIPVSQAWKCLGARPSDERSEDRCSFTDLSA